MNSHVALYAIAFAVSLILALVLTPLARELNRRIGMVDKPDPRRINKVPIPRGGGIAVFASSMIAFFVLVQMADATIYLGTFANTLRLFVLSLGITLVGYSDDKFSLPPKLKLLGQIIVAFLTWWWADLGFNDLWPALPRWIDCVMTVFWIVGAVNAFNLIDGLDGLATGLALIATLGMCTSLLFAGHMNGLLFYFTFAGALVGFLRYNYHPASVFLGDSGSMFIGYMLATLPLCSHAPNSFLVSVGVPMLSMGVPIFDTALALVRRSIRHLLRKSGEDFGNDKIMTADTDHLHHRILRSVGLNQRKAAWALYLIALFLVGTGLVGTFVTSHTAGVWVAAVAIALVIAFRDMERVELFDAGRLLSHVAERKDFLQRRGLIRLIVPLYMTLDILILIGTYFFCCWALRIPLTTVHTRSPLVIHATVSFVSLVVIARAYTTVWSRAVAFNYVRLLLACCAGSLIGTLATYFIPNVAGAHYKIFTILYALVPFMVIATLRLSRMLMRDFVFELNWHELNEDAKASRMLVYGTGLHGQSFCRECIRKTMKDNRVIVGILDDDILQRHHYIGRFPVLGGLDEAPAAIRKTGADTVVLAMSLAPERRDEIVRVLKPCGVKIIHFTLSEETL